MLLRRRTAVSVVTLVTRAGCHLCEEAHVVAKQAALEVGAVFEVLDVDVDPALPGWSVKVPVVLFDGVEHAYWQIEPRALRKALGLRV